MRLSASASRLSFSTNSPTSLTTATQRGTVVPRGAHQFPVPPPTNYRPPTRAERRSHTMPDTDIIRVSRKALIKHLDALYTNIGVEPAHLSRVIDFVLAQIVVSTEDAR